MTNYIHACPGCGSTKDSIGWSASYFDVYECSKCGRKYCHKCDGSNGARYCPKCGSTEASKYGTVSKP